MPIDIGTITTCIPIVRIRGGGGSSDISSSPSLPDDDSQNFGPESEDDNQNSGPESDDDNQNSGPESDDDNRNFGPESDEDFDGLQFGQGQGDSSQSDSDLDSPNEILSLPSSSSKSKESDTNDQNFRNDTTAFQQYIEQYSIENIDIDYSTGSALSDETSDDTISTDDEVNSGIFDCFGESNFPEEYLSDDEGDELYEQNEDSPDIAICRTLAQTILSKKSPKERRPLLSIVASSVPKTKAESEVFMNGHKFTPREWAQARKHAIYPGVGEPVKDVHFFRRQLENDTVDEFMEWLFAADLLQSLSFGHKVISYSNGYHVSIESVKRKQRIRQIVREYVSTWRKELSEDIEIDGERCEKRCSKTKLQCLHTKKHESQRCKFTPDQKLSPSTVERILNQITSGNMKSLRGLDNTYVEKGSDSFQAMKGIVKKLSNVCSHDEEGQEMATALLSKIDEVDLFHKVGFPRHLDDKNSQYLCTCLDCGFFHKDDEDNGENPCTKDHSCGICKECKDSFNLFAELFEFYSRTYTQLHENNILPHKKCVEDDMLSWLEEIRGGLRNLHEYRRHVAQKEDESAFDKDYYRDLGEDEAIIIMDYKMKILSSYFREKQVDWFSKRGFSCLGAMIIFGSSDESLQNKVLYHLFISEDTTQNAAAVNDAKQ